MIFIFSFFYFIIKDKNLRRSYHDIISNTVVFNALKTYNEPLLPKKDHIIYLSTVSIIAVFFISIGILFSPEIPSLDGQFENSNEMISKFENDYSKYSAIAEEISDINNVAVVNEINLIEVNNRERTLEFVARPELFTNHDHILEDFAKVVKKNSSMLKDYDHINLKLEYNINMTLAIFHWKNLSFQVNIDFGKE